MQFTTIKPNEITTAQKETLDAGCCPHCLSRDLFHMYGRMTMVGCNKCEHLYILAVEESLENA
jgi:uncharacterized protein (DUF983 family)